MLGLPGTPGMLQEIFLTAGGFRLTVLAKLLLATALGGAIGIEREISGKPAGLRTNILICIGAALFTHLSIEIAEIGFAPDHHPFGDTTHIAGQIVSGIGFLGAGAILHGEGAIVGLTTAATIWVVAAVGMAIGAGAFADATETTVVIVLILVGLRPFERRLMAKRRHVRATLRVPAGTPFDEFDKTIRESGLHIAFQRSFEHDTDRTFELELIGATKDVDTLCTRLRANKNVVSLTTD